MTLLEDIKCYLSVSSVMCPHRQPAGGMESEMGWHYLTKCIYSVKSGKTQAKAQHGCPESAGLGQQQMQQAF